MPIERLRSWHRKSLPKALLTLLGTWAVISLAFLLIRLTLPLLPEPIGSRSELFYEGSTSTLKLTLLSGALGLAIGFALALGKLQRQPIVRVLCSSWVGLLRGTPLLVQILFAYYALPVLAPFLKLSEFTASLIALAFNVAAYNAEAIRGGILAIPRGQFEAAHSLGLSRWQTLRFVILPQSLKVSVAPLMNCLVALLKDSSLASTIGLLELSLAGNRISSETFQPIPVLITVSTIYLIQTMVISFSASLLERRLR